MYLYPQSEVVSADYLTAEWSRCSHFDFIRSAVFVTKVGTEWKKNISVFVLYFDFWVLRRFNFNYPVVWSQHVTPLSGTKHYLNRPLTESGNINSWCCCCLVWKDSIDEGVTAGSSPVIWIILLKRHSWLIRPAVCLLASGGKTIQILLLGNNTSDNTRT